MVTTKKELIEERDMWKERALKAEDDVADSFRIVVRLSEEATGTTARHVAAERALEKARDKAVAHGAANWSPTNDARSETWTDALHIVRAALNGSVIK